MVSDFPLDAHAVSVRCDGTLKDIRVTQRVNQPRADTRRVPRFRVTPYREKPAQSFQTVLSFLQQTGLLLLGCIWVAPPRQRNEKTTGARRSRVRSLLPLVARAPRAQRARFVFLRLRRTSRPAARPHLIDSGADEEEPRVIRVSLAPMRGDTPLGKGKGWPGTRGKVVKWARADVLREAPLPPLCLHAALAPSSPLPFLCRNSRARRHKRDAMKFSLPHPTVIG